MTDERDEDLDALMADAFGSTADEEYTEPVEDEGEEPEDAPEADLEEEEPADAPDEEPEDEDAEDGDYDLEEEDEGDEEDDDTAEGDEPEVGGDDGESEDEGGDLPEGDGAAEPLSDGLMALDLMVDSRLEAYRPPNDDFDASVVGTEKEFLEDAKEAFGDDFEEDYVEKMGRATYKTAVRRAERRHAAEAKSRLGQRRDAATERLGAQVQQLSLKAPQEVQRVEARMAQIYQQKADAYGVDAANEIPVEVYFRLAGGQLTAPKQKAAGRPGVASRKARAQKQQAVRATQKPDQIGRIRTGKRKKRSAEAQALADLGGYMDTHTKIESFFFGE